MKFGLKKKLLAVFSFMLLITLLIGFISIRRFSQLGRSIDVILKENYISVVACEQMKDAIERIDSGVLLLLLGYRLEGEVQIRENLERFNAALETEQKNLTLPAEPANAARLSSFFIQYCDTLRQFRTTDSSVLRNDYFQELQPLFLNVKNSANAILLMNQQNMNQANNRARIMATKARRDMILFLLFSLLVAIIIISLSNRWIRKPIQRLIQSTREIRNGNLNLAVQVESRDEIGQLSEAFNHMVESLRFLRRTDHSKLSLIQRSTQEAFKNLPEAIAIINANGVIEVASEPARLYFGLTPDRRIEESSFTWLAEFFTDVVKKKKMAAKEYKHGIAQVFIHNQEKFFQPKALPILDFENELTGLILILEDITLLQQSDEIKRNLFATVSHQLKTPLTSIRMALHLLLDEKIGDLNAQQTDLLVSAREESERLFAIIEDLLDISRIESGKIKMNLEAVPPRELIEQALETFRQPAQDKGVTIDASVPADLPEVQADRSRLSHVLGNLIANAIKNTPAGGHVHVSALADAGKVKFLVSDNGRGIPGQYQSKIFEKFFRIPGRESDGGAGLGLAIAREIIRAHDGEISFVSSKKMGTIFEFSLKPSGK